MAFCESGDEVEVCVPFCGGAVSLPEEEPLLEAVAEADERVRLGREEPVASAVLVRAVPVASEENGQWKGMEEEGSVPKEVGPGPW